MAGFLDKVVVGINKGVNSVSEGSKNLVEKAKLNVQIQETEAERNNIIQNMGNLIYNLHVSGELQIEQCVPMCGEISALNQKIADLQEQIRVIEASKAQPAAYQPQPAAAPVNTGAVCQCGFRNKEGAKFCSKCGSQLA